MSTPEVVTEVRFFVHTDDEELQAIEVMLEVLGFGRDPFRLSVKQRHRVLSYVRARTLDRSDDPDGVI